MAGQLPKKKRNVKKNKLIDNNAWLSTAPMPTIDSAKIENKNKCKISNQICNVRDYNTHVPKPK